MRDHRVDDVLEAVVDPVVAHIADHFLGTTDGDRRLRGDLPRQFEDPIHQCGLVRVGTIDQADAPCLFAVDHAPGVGQLAHHAIADDPRQALQGADVGGHADVDLLDRELRVGGRVAHVAGRDQVDGAAQAVALDRREHRLAAVVDRVERGLQLENLATQGVGVAADVLAQLAADLGQQHQVDPRGKMLARPGQHDHPHFVGIVDPAEDLDDLAPEVLVHGIDLVRTVDLDVGDLVCQLHTECVVLGHGDSPRQSNCAVRTQRFLLCGKSRNYNKGEPNVDAALCDARHAH